MLNITENTVAGEVELEEFKSYHLIHQAKATGWIGMVLGAFLIVSIAVMFMPWTQNVNAKGYVTTRSPEARPQGIQAVIAGQIENWYVQEGDYVSAGDTIAYITEVKSEYFDPNLVERTAEQVDAKVLSVESYEDKVAALDLQARAVREALEVKIGQIRNKIIQVTNKIQIDSADLAAEEANLEIALNQLDRTQQLYDKGLKSLSELQEKQLKVQEVQAKVTSQRNKLLNQRNELANAKLELPLTRRDAAEKLAKIASDRQSALSDRAASLGDVAKLRNQESNYRARREFYYILAPQDGYVTKAVKKGVGEIIKEGDDIATIVPANYDLAVELYIKPQDLPLVDVGEIARVRFDGWPAIIISGWPEASTGIFTGQVVVVDRFISDNGNYRILISPAADERDWPEELRVGTGAQAFILLNDVPVWYELWRQLNGFPAQFYDEDAKDIPETVKKKPPLKSVK